MQVADSILPISYHHIHFSEKNGGNLEASRPKNILKWNKNDKLKIFPNLNFESVISALKCLFQSKNLHDEMSENGQMKSKYENVVSDRSML